MMYTALDLLFFLLFFFSALAGFSRGLIAEVVNVGTWVVAVAIAGLFAQELSNYFMSIPDLQRLINSASSSIGMNVAEAASYLSLFFSFLILFSLAMAIGSAVGTFVTYAFAATGLGIVNRLMGTVFGLGKGIVISVVIAFLVQLTSLGAQSWWQSSIVVNELQPGVQWLANFTAPGMEAIRGKFGESIDKVSSTLQGAVSKVTSQ